MMERAQLPRAHKETFLLFQGTRKLLSIGIGFWGYKLLLSLLTLEE